MPAYLGATFYDASFCMKCMELPKNNLKNINIAHQHCVTGIASCSLRYYDSFISKSNIASVPSYLPSLDTTSKVFVREADCISKKNP